MAKSYSSMKLFITNERMLQLVDYSLSKGLVATRTEFFDEIGFTPTNLTNVKNGKQNFTHPQIQAACKFTGVSADWIYGLTNVMRRKPESKDPMAILKEAVANVESQLKKSR